MIKFETIDGTLCRMVEPEPLQLDSPMPCVVRYIQDCSPMGRYMKRKYAMVINTVAIVSRIGIDWRAYCSDKIFGEEVETLEIIGYPVVEGSKEWALYQMMQGLKVCNPQLAKDKAARLGCDDETFNTFWYIVGDAVVEGEGNYGTLSVSSWIAAASSTGWQIYKEPKPEPAMQYKVGDWVKYDIDSYLQVIEPSGRDRTLCRTLSGRIVFPNTSCLTKASPSEVVIQIGCLRGTVKRWDSTTFHMFHGNSKFSKIHFDALDNKTRELVESLLKAQEEECQ